MRTKWYLRLEGRLIMQSLEEIYEMYSRKVFLFLMSKTNDEHLAEELTQETFFQAVQCINQFEGKSSI